MRDNTYISKGNREYGAVKIPKAEWKPIYPPRFVYHLTRGGKMGTISESFYFQRISIYLYGLCGIDKGRGGVIKKGKLILLMWWGSNYNFEFKTISITKFLIKL